MKLFHILAALSLGASVFADSSDTHNKAILATFVTVTTTEYLNGTPTGTLTENTPSGLAPSVSRGESTYVTTLFSNGQAYTTVSQTVLPQIVVAQTVYQTVTVDLATVSGYGSQTDSESASPSASGSDGTFSGSDNASESSDPTETSNSSSVLVESSSTYHNSSSSFGSISSHGSSTFSNGNSTTITTSGGRFQNSTITSSSLTATHTDEADSGSHSRSGVNSTSTTVSDSNPDNAGSIGKFSPYLIFMCLAMAVI
ncbi:BA75_01990T0 [Komagataella pastoris]|uniref:BA75_01990T0 n=1 Tax=Komagataella pastoris TaxID=4922 RepID=A0A1B2JEB7_PICPA|nr:BA75_01990T0 [Komagataella pastoris]